MRKKNYLALFIILSIVLLTTCSHRKTAPDTEALSIKNPPVMTEENLVPYKLNAGDVLEIKFYKINELNGQTTIRADGRATFPRIGDVFVLGKTTGEVDEELTRLYSGLFNAPDITVAVIQTVKPQIYVLGEVRAPGRFEFQAGMTALQAISMAGGWLESANLGSVILLRAQQSPDAPVPIRLDLKKAVKGETGDTYLASQDIIYLPESFINKLDEFMNRFFNYIEPPGNLILRGYYYYNIIDIQDEQNRLREEQLNENP
jgi:polysaccharide export outer membrane protein